MPEMQRSKEDATLDLIIAASTWWVHKRPSNWTEVDHLKKPTIHCLTQADKDLAETIATYREADREARRIERGWSLTLD